MMYTLGSERLPYNALAPRALPSPSLYESAPRGKRPRPTAPRPATVSRVVAAVQSPTTESDSPYVHLHGPSGKEAVVSERSRAAERRGNSIHTLRTAVLGRSTSRMILILFSPISYCDIIYPCTHRIARSAATWCQVVRQDPSLTATLRSRTTSWIHSIGGRFGWEPFGAILRLLWRHSASPSTLMEAVATLRNWEVEWRRVPLRLS